MDQGYAMIIVAVITTVGAVLVAIMQKGRKENREDHALVVDQLRFINKNIDRVSYKVDESQLINNKGMIFPIHQQEYRPRFV